jgi:hypothetical protein
MEDTEDLKRVQAALDTLSEHFDTVHVFATRHESGEQGGTVNVNLGVGNWFARYGQIQEWLVKQEEVTRQAQRGDHPS